MWKRQGSRLVFTRGIERIFEEKKTIVTSAPFSWGEEKGLLLKDIDETEFYKFIEKLRKFLEKVIDELSEVNKSS